MRNRIAIQISALVLCGLFFSAHNAAQSLQRGVSVVLPKTQNAVEMRAADREDAKVIAITRNGDIFLGTDKTTPDDLVQNLRSHPFHKPATLFIKADAQSSYSEVAKVLDPLRGAGFDKLLSTVLLTAQPSTSSVLPAPPMGLQILLNRPTTASKPIVIQMPFPESPALLNIDGERVSRDQLTSELKKRIQARSENLVMLIPGPQVHFSDVVEIIDAAKSAGARVALATPAL